MKIECPRCGREFDEDQPLNPEQDDSHTVGDEIHNCLTKSYRNMNHFECPECGYIECPDCEAADRDSDEEGGDDIPEFPPIC